jgi:hypothetical protein
MGLIRYEWDWDLLPQTKGLTQKKTPILTRKVYASWGMI